MHRNNMLNVQHYAIRVKTHNAKIDEYLVGRRHAGLAGWQ